MSKEEHSNWLESCKRDPLWWMWIISLVTPAVTAVLDLAGVIDSDQPPFSMPIQVSWFAFGVILILVAIRNKDLGEDKPMNKGLRAFCALLGIFVAGVALVLGIIPNLD